MWKTKYGKKNLEKKMGSNLHEHCMKIKNIFNMI